MVCEPEGGGPEALKDKPSKPRQVWNRIPEEVREQIVELALDEPEPSPQEVATCLTDVREYFVSGGFGLSAAQGSRPDHEPSLHRREGRR